MASLITILPAIKKIVAKHGVFFPKYAQSITVLGIRECQGLVQAIWQRNRRVSSYHVNSNIFLDESRRLHIMEAEHMARKEMTSWGAAR